MAGWAGCEPWAARAAVAGRRWAGPLKVAASPVIGPRTRTAAVLLMVVSFPPSRTLATAATTTRLDPSGARTVTSTAFVPETLPSAHTRAPGTTAPSATVAPAVGPVGTVPLAPAPAAVPCRLAPEDACSPSVVPEEAVPLGRAC
ncbi:hypothetical protein ACFMQL_08925 [Nonomuraea fastidiosa]|uniref:hypothetical protein n=1 Tax=Nonomuraea fastidiosa TaxID=46173 RepID=UPI00367292F7